MRFVFFILVALWVPFAATAQEADDGPGYLAGLLQDALSGSGRDVQIRGFQGALSSEASIQLLSISDDDGEWFRAEDVTLVWTRSALLRGIVDVNAFTAERIVISRQPLPGETLPSAEATPFRIPELPVSVIIEEINARSVILGAPLAGEEAEFTITGAARLDDQETDIQFNLERTDGDNAQIALSASYDPRTRALAIDLAAEEDAGGLVGRVLDIPNQPELALTVQGEGEIDDFAAELSLATGGQPRVTGTVAILAPEAENSWDVRVDITGDPSPVLAEDMQNFFGTDIAVQARLIRDASGRIDLPEFTLAARALDLSGTAAIGANGWPETFEVTGQMVNPDGGPVVLPFGGGDTSVSEVTFDAALNGDLRFDARMSDFENAAAKLNQLTVTGRGDIDPQSFSADGRFDLGLSFAAEALDMRDPALTAAIGRNINGAAQVNYVSEQPVQITSLEIAGEDYGLTGLATWNAENTIPLALDLRLIAQNIARFSDIAGRDLSGRVEVSIEGDVGPVSGLADIVIDGTTLDIQVGEDVANRALAGVGSARIDVRRDETGTTLRSMRVVTAAANIEAAGKITSEDTALRFGGELRSLDVLFPGEADGNADLTGSVILSGTQLERLEVNAELSNQAQAVLLPFAGGLELNSGVVQAVATGGANGAWDLNVEVDDVVSSVLSSDQLQLAGEGPLLQSESGGLRSIGGDLVANTTGLRMADPRISQALGATPSASASFDWTQDIERLTVNQFDLETGVLDATGSALVQQALSAPNAQVAATVVADSFAPLSGLAGQPLRGRGTLDITGSYETAGPFNLVVDGQAAGLGLGGSIINRLLNGVTEFEASVTGNDAQIDRMEARVENPEISAQVSGPLTGLEISARLRELGLIAPDFAGPLSLNGTVAQRNDAVSLDINLNGPGGTTLAVDGSVVDGSNANVSITGDAPLGLANAFIEPRRLNGRAQLDLALRGPLSLSSLSGTITPQGAELSAPTLAIVLAPITGQITLQNSAAQIALAAQGNNGGTLDVNGRLGLNGFDAALTAVLTRFGIQDPALYDTSVDGTGSLTGPIGRDLLIAGDLRLNETEIQVPSSGAFALGDIPNIEHLGATRPVMRTIARAGLNETEASAENGPRRATSRLDLTLSAPNRVFVRGRGLDAELGGNLRLTGPTNDIIPQGGFELVRGRLDVLNQRFVLDEGRIQLSGSFTPVLRFVASTESNGITVQVILDGPASSPDISFTSTPELPEDEVLAQLLFGRNLSNLSALQALELANAVATLAGGGAGGLLSNLRDGFGLDDLDVTQTEDGSAAVRAGAYISENVYTDVVVESGGRTEINLNLDVTSDITARGSVDNNGNSSIGVFFERDY